MLELIVSDSRVDIQYKLLDLIKIVVDLAPISHRDTCFKILLSDERVDVEKLSSSQFQSILDVLETPIETRAVLEEEGAEALLLRYIVIKRPTSVQLLDWMIDSKCVEFTQAADLVLKSQTTSNKTVEPVRALLDSLLYPSMLTVEILWDVDADSKSSALRLLQAMKDSQK